jgi:hypothetical protein
VGGGQPGKIECAYDVDAGVFFGKMEDLHRCPALAIQSYPRSTGIAFCEDLEICCYLKNPGEQERALPLML